MVGLDLPTCDNCQLNSSALDKETVISAPPLGLGARRGFNMSMPERDAIEEQQVQPTTSEGYLTHNFIQQRGTSCSRYRREQLQAEFRS